MTEYRREKTAEAGGIDTDALDTASGELMKSLRLAAGATPDQFADRLGWDRKLYAATEVGALGLDLPSLIDLAWTMGFPPETALTALLCYLPVTNKPRAFSLNQCQIFRLAWVDQDGRSRDAEPVFDRVDTACEKRPMLNIMRKAEGNPPLTRISAYVLMGHLLVPDRPTPVSPQATPPGTNGIGPRGSAEIHPYHK